MSKKSQHNGAEWERYIAAELAEIRARDLGLIDRNHDAQRVRGDSHKRRAKTKPDYSGTLRGGISVVIEAKFVDGGASFPLSRLAPHQLEYLTETARLGGLAFVYVCHKTESRLDKYLIPIATIHHYQATRQSVPFSEVDGARKRPGEILTDVILKLRPDLAACMMPVSQEAPR